MSTTLRALALAVSLSLTLVPAALAGGSAVNVEGPMKDGRYVVRAFSCSGAASLHVTAFAEGVVKGQRRTLPLELATTKDAGVYTFQRSWPEQGRWLLRVELDGRGFGAVAAVSHDGRVGKNEFVSDADALHACDQKLAANMK